MIKALRKYLIEHTSIPVWMGYSFADASTQKPFGTFRRGGRSRDLNNIEGGLISFEIRPYLDDQTADYADLDRVAREVRLALSDAIITTSDGSRFMVEFVSEGSDYRDPDWKALTRPMYFQIPTVGR